VVAPAGRPAPHVLPQLRFPVSVSPTASLSVACGEGRWGNLFREDSVRFADRPLGMLTAYWVLDKLLAWPLWPLESLIPLEEEGKTTNL
jgi:hypothetical protein